MDTLNIAGTKKSSTTAILKNSSAATYTAKSSIKTVNASSRTKAIKITGNALANSIVGGSKNDTIYGGGGKDTIRGNSGNDKLYGQADNDVIYGGKDNFIYKPGEGKDRIMDYDYSDGDMLTILKSNGKTGGSFKSAKFSDGELTLAISGGGNVIFEDVSKGDKFKINGKTYTVKGTTLK